MSPAHICLMQFVLLIAFPTKLIGTIYAFYVWTTSIFNDITLTGRTNIRKQKFINHAWNFKKNIILNVLHQILSLISSLEDFLLAIHAKTWELLLLLLLLLFLQLFLLYLIIFFIFFNLKLILISFHFLFFMKIFLTISIIIIFIF